MTDGLLISTPRTRLDCAWTLFLRSLLLILMEVTGTELGLTLARDQAVHGLGANTLSSRVDRNFRAHPSLSINSGEKQTPKPQRWVTLLSPFKSIRPFRLNSFG